MYINNWALMIITTEPFSIIAGIFLIISYWLKQKNEIASYLLNLFVVLLLLTFPFLVIKYQLTLKEVITIYYFFTLTVFIPAFLSFYLKRSVGKMALIFYVLQFIGLAIYISTGLILGISPQ